MMAGAATKGCAMGTTIEPPALVPLFRMKIELGTPLVLFTHLGTRTPVSVTGGTFTGDRLSGTMVPGGVDWLLIDGGGIWHVDVRAVLQIDGGPLVTTTYDGRVRLPEGGLERVMAGGSIAADEMYFRTAPTFEVEPGEYDWLNSVQAIGVGALGPGTVTYDVFEVA